MKLSHHHQFTAIPTAEYQQFLAYQRLKIRLVALLQVLKYPFAIIMMLCPFALFWVAEWYLGVPV